MARSAISAVRAREIFDSRGRPTVEADVVLSDGSFGRAAVPSGASTGRHEALELRDGDETRLEGRGVTRAVANVHEHLAPAVTGMDACDQEALDRRQAELDGTPNLGRLGANAVLAVSMAACRAAANHRRIPLHEHIAGLAGTRPTMPLPMVNILSGGAHAGRGMDFQDFLAVPVGARDTMEALIMVLDIRAAANRVAARRGLPVLLADEGGLSPGLRTAEAALDLMMEVFREAGKEPGRDVAIAIDVASSELWDAQAGRYRFACEGVDRNPAEMRALVRSIRSAYPVVSIEDPLDQEAWDDWPALMREMGDTQIVGDDFFVTNAARIRRGHAAGAANSVLIKLNQNGTVSGALAAIAAARSCGFTTVVSARSGETEDCFMSDLAVGTGAGQIKVGSVRASERMSKYNQLIRIAEAGGIDYAGRGALPAAGR